MASTLEISGAVAGALMLASCSNFADCVSLSVDDVLADVGRVAALSRTLDLSMTQRESATVVGAAIGFSQMERATVRVCLRSGADHQAEFRIVAHSGAEFEWRKVSAFYQGTR
jgi:hypothetical protein